MIRISRLNEAADCGLAASIEDKSTNAAAMMGDAFHAAVAAHYRGTDAFNEARAIAIGQLGGEHEAEVLEKVAALAAIWTPPTRAIFEAGIGLSRRGLAVPYGSPDAMTQGTPDCVWSEPDEVVVLDFKSGARAEWTVPIPRENLQLAGYGIAYADEFGKSKMRLGIYLAAEVKWLWDLVDLDAPEGTSLWERVRAAALRDPEEAVKGPHCSDCWVRLRCRAHLLPILSAGDRATALEPLGEAVGLVEPRKLMRLLQACQAMESIAEKGKEWLKAYVKERGPIVVDGKAWGPTEVKGREGTSVKALKEAGLYDRAVAVGAVKQGPPTFQHRWKKATAATTDLAPVAVMPPAPRRLVSVEAEDQVPDWAKR